MEDLLSFPTDTN